MYFTFTFSWFSSPQQNVRRRQTYPYVAALRKLGGTFLTWRRRRVFVVVGNATFPFHILFQFTRSPSRLCWIFKMTETLQLRGTLLGHNGWVTQIATNPKHPDMILSASRGKFFLNVFNFPIPLSVGRFLMQKSRYISVILWIFSFLFHSLHFGSNSSMDFNRICGIKWLFSPIIDGNVCEVMLTNVFSRPHR